MSNSLLKQPILNVSEAQKFSLKPNYRYYLNLLLFSAVISGIMYYEAYNPSYKELSSVSYDSEAFPLGELYSHVSEISNKYKDKYDIKVLKGENGFTIHMTMGHLFRPGKASFDVDSERYFYKYISSLRVHTQKVSVEVEGYSDPNPVTGTNESFPTNWELSTARAAFIGRLFIDAGLDKERLKISGRADSQPLNFTKREIASMDEYTRKLKQRRVVIYVKPSI